MMTNIEKLARLIVKLGNADKTMQQLAVMLHDQQKGGAQA